ncbi:UPF0728 protein C10orf53 homolog [Leptinotarsa decemlineata]|uniref:UPF0728 protein C10orf53 homolog n=1 Tax=Leptinotarsa decemlineata TaxID=7539 RepID=UPI000C253809|nr:UPF0728 protein C10orf53 homolog [Leptinotarsa decemlineata]
MVFIKISYGPYEAHGVIRHRIQRLRGLLRHLSELGYEIEVAEVNLFNRVEIEMFERRIFIGDIRNFKFNESYEDDPVCQKAVAAVEEAKSRMAVEENVRSFIPIEQGMRYVQRVSHGIDTQELLLDSELLFEIPDKQRASTIKEETSDGD